MRSTPVHIDAPPFSAALLAWGWDGSHWWGLVTWTQRIRYGPDHDLATLECGAWVPSRRLTKPLWLGTPVVRRIQLAGEPADWPRPPGWTGWYAGAWLAGAAPLPAGVTAVNGPAWRDHDKRRP